MQKIIIVTYINSYNDTDSSGEKGLFKINGPSDLQILT